MGMSSVDMYLPRFWSYMTETEHFNLGGVKFSESASAEVRASSDYRKGVADGILSHYDQAIEDTARLAYEDAGFFRSELEMHIYNLLSRPEYKDAITAGRALPNPDPKRMSGGEIIMD
ncbi:MAG: hypothetical protein ACTHJ4_05020 [Candidatus Nucleicultricaceae bacterium]